jgi:uncharacterized cupin superfamily protein
VVVLRGRPRLRTPDEWRELEEGDVVAFPRGERGAHQLVNRSNETVRFLAFSTSGEPDIVIRPDSATVGVYERLPDGDGLRAVFRMADRSTTTRVRRRRARSEKGRRRGSIGPHPLADLGLILEVLPRVRHGLRDP